MFYIIAKWSSEETNHKMLKNIYNGYTSSCEVEVTEKGNTRIL